MHLDDIFFSAMDDIQRFETVEAGRKVLDRLKDKYNLANIVYHSPRSPGHGEGPFLCLTYPEEWINHYIGQNYFAIDPVVQLGFGRALPLDWDKLDKSSSVVRNFFGEAADANLGKHGLSISMNSAGGASALVSITSNAGDKEWQRDRIMLMRDFQLLAHYMHGRFNRVLGISLDNDIHLSRREIECLQWAAEGKTNDDIATILGLSERTIRLYLDTARHKLNCLNKTHAVAKALSLGLICYTEQKSTFNMAFLTD